MCSGHRSWNCCEVLNPFQYLISHFFFHCLTLTLSFTRFFSLSSPCQEAAGQRRKVPILDLAVLSARGTRRDGCLILRPVLVVMNHLLSSLCLTVICFPSFLSSTLSYYLSHILLQLYKGYCFHSCLPVKLLYQQNIPKITSQITYQVVNMAKSTR